MRPQPEFIKDEFIFATYLGEYANLWDDMPCFENRWLEEQWMIYLTIYSPPASRVIRCYSGERILVGACG